MDLIDQSLYQLQPTFLSTIFFSTHLCHFFNHKIRILYMSILYSNVSTPYTLRFAIWSCIHPAVSIYFKISHLIVHLSCCIQESVLRVCDYALWPWTKLCTGSETCSVSHLWIWKSHICNKKKVKNLDLAEINLEK